MHQHPPGRLTMPRVPLTDRAFVYTNSAATDVRTTMQRARHLLEQEALQQRLAAAKAQPALPGVPEAPPRRMRAGLAQGQHLALPQI
mgnify:CR=1 FL=1